MNIRTMKFHSVTWILTASIAALTGCADTPQQRQDRQLKFMSKLQGMPIRSFVVFRNMLDPNAPIVPVANGQSTYQYIGDAWEMSYRIPDVIVPFDRQSHEKDYCEANGGTLNYMGRVPNPVAVRTVIQSASAYYRDNPYAQQGNPAQDTFVYAQQLQNKDISQALGMHLEKHARYIDAKLYGKFECATHNGRRLFKVTYSALAVNSGDSRVGQVPTAIGATIRTRLYYEFN